MAQTEPGPGGLIRPAHRSRIPPDAETQLAAALAWIAVASRGRLSQPLIDSAMSHHRTRRTEPGILIAAAIQYLLTGADREDDRVNRFWHIADQISARERARYLNIREEDLQ